MHGFYFVRSTYLLVLVYTTRSDLVSKADERMNDTNNEQD